MVLPSWPIIGRVSRIEAKRNGEQHNHDNEFWRNDTKPKERNETKTKTTNRNETKLGTTWPWHWTFLFVAMLLLRCVIHVAMLLLRCVIFVAIVADSWTCGSYLWIHGWTDSETDSDLLEASGVDKVVRRPSRSDMKNTNWKWDKDKLEVTPYTSDIPAILFCCIQFSFVPDFASCRVTVFGHKAILIHQM